MISFFKNFDLYEVNVSEFILDYTDGTKYNPVALGSCNPESINLLIPKIKKMQPVRINELLSDWEALRCTKENLRILENNRIVNVEETYYYRAIL